MVGDFSCSRGRRSNFRKYKKSDMVWVKKFLGIADIYYNIK